MTSQLAIVVVLVALAGLFVLRSMLAVLRSKSDQCGTCSCARAPGPPPSVRPLLPLSRLRSHDKSWTSSKP